MLKRADDGSTYNEVTVAIKSRLEMGIFQFSESTNTFDDMIVLQWSHNGHKGDLQMTMTSNPFRIYTAFQNEDCVDALDPMTEL